MPWVDHMEATGRKENGAGHSRVQRSITELQSWLGGHYGGWDPYDGIYSETLPTMRWGDSYMKRVLIQFHRISPLNLREFFGVKKGVSTKGLSLFLRGYLNLYSATRDEIYLEEAKRLSDIIIDDSLIGKYGEHAWASHYFTFLSIDGGATPPDSYDLIGTINVLKALSSLHNTSPDLSLEEVIRSCQSFLLKKVERRDNFTYFQYAPQYVGKIVPNASAEALSAISLSFESQHNNDLRALCDEVLGTLLRMQREDGSWVYSIYPNGTEYNQMDFHQGYLVDGLLSYRRYAPSEVRERLETAIERSAECYKGLFHNGRGLYRAPRKYPADIHNQAQGIITFSHLHEAYPNRSYLEIAENIAHWTIDNMQDGSGYFYYQKGRLITNRIPYMRWGQAWMFLALSSLLMCRGRASG